MVAGPRNQLHQSLSGIHRFPSGSNKGHKHALLNRSRHRWALDPNIFLRFPAFLFRAPLHKIHQTPLQFSFGFYLRCAVHLGGGSDVFVPKQSLHFFERKPGFLAPGAHGVPKTVPANFRKTRFDCYRLHVILQYLARPQRPASFVERRSEHPIVRLVVWSDRAPLVQKINNVIRQ